MPADALPFIALGAGLVALAALVVAVVALVVGRRAVRALDRVADRLAPPAAGVPAAVVPSPNAEEAEPPLPGKLRLLVESSAGRGATAASLSRNKAFDETVHRHRASGRRGRVAGVRRGRLQLGR